ncbi:MAG: vWA domain-containing protein [Planctomycetota bacterium]
MDQTTPNSTAPPDAHADRDADELRPGLVAWVRRHKVPVLVTSASISLLVHLVFGIIAALWMMNRPPAQIGSAQPEVEFAVMTDAELAQIAQADLELDAPDASDSAAALELSAELDLGELEVDLSELTDSIGDVTLQLGGGDVEGLGLGVGESVGAGASFFGVEARGNRFAFVVDISGSMRLDGKLEAMKAELIRSLSALFTSSNFFVIFYSGGAFPLGGRGVDWVEATDSGKAWARSNVLRVEANGPTFPLGAFEELLRLDPRPDAIYFMTDGEFQDQQADGILNVFRRIEAPIHCITFGSREGEAIMRRIATSTRGTYTHVEGPRG